MQGTCKVVVITLIAFIVIIIIICSFDKNISYQIDLLNFMAVIVAAGFTYTITKNITKALEKEKKEREIVIDMLVNLQKEVNSEINSLLILRVDESYYTTVPNKMKNIRQRTYKILQTLKNTGFIKPESEYPNKISKNLKEILDILSESRNLIKPNTNTDNPEETIQRKVKSVLTQLDINIFKLIMEINKNN